MRTDQIADSKGGEYDRINKRSLGVAGEVGGGKRPAEQIRHAEDELKPSASEQSPFVSRVSLDEANAEQSGHVGNVGTDGDPNDSVWKLSREIAEERFNHGDESTGRHLQEHGV